MKTIAALGELGLINRIKNKHKSSILKGIGDDAAIVKVGNTLLAYTTDIQVENVHFSKKWFSPLQIGKKAIEINVSDIHAMGGDPKQALISLVLPKSTDLLFFDKLFEGFQKASKKHKVELIGGNISSGKQLIIDIMMIGEVKKENLSLRSQAKVGDLIYTTGPLGLSNCGLQLHKKRKQGFTNIKKHFLQPVAQGNKIKKIRKHINAMIDISDGLSSEIHHLCEQSNKGAIIDKKTIPITKEHQKAAKLLKQDPYNHALYGGEDFALLFTIPKRYKTKVPKPCFCIGEITKEKTITLLEDADTVPLRREGYDHLH